MELWIGSDAERFAALAQGFVEAQVQRNVLATVLAAVRSGRYAEAIFAVLSDERSETVAVAIRTPPHLMLAGGLIADADGFMRAWLDVDPACPGVSAEPDLAGHLTDAWSRATRGTAEIRVREAMHVLEVVTPPEPPTPGILRLADWRQSAQLGGWGVAFGIDTGMRNAASAPAAIDHSLRERRLYVWERENQSVAMVGHNLMVAGTVRVGPVYTPEPLRGRGYATAATAAVSQLMLDQGAQRCMLYTDLANPISNHIYAKIGYERIADWDEYRFIPRS
jgi:RimJ/RimL family protein N-acetyltransferase